MTTYLYEDMEPGLDIERIHQNVLNSAMTNKTILGCTMTGAELKIDFTDPLSAGDETLLDAIVAGVPVPPPSKDEPDFQGVAFTDEFLGESLSPQWATAAQGGGSAVSIQNGRGGQIVVRGGGGNGRYAKLMLKSTGHVAASHFPSFKIRAKTVSVSNVELLAAILFVDSNNLIGLRSVGGNWFLRTKNGGVLTDVDTGVSTGTNWRTLEIQATPQFVKAFVDGALVATSTTNIPLGLGVPLVMSTTTSGTDAKDFILDTAQFQCAREA